MGVDSLWHLIEDSDFYESDTWCGQLSPNYTEDVTLANCLVCLKAAAEYGTLVQARLKELESTSSPLR